MAMTLGPDGHPEEPYLFDLALGRAGTEVREHVAWCGSCDHRVSKYRGLIADIRLEHDFVRQVQAELTRPATPEELNSPAYRKVQNMMTDARNGDRGAEELIRCAELGDDEMKASFNEYAKQPFFPFVLLYACQGASRLAAHVPGRALLLARTASLWGEMLNEPARQQPVSRPLVLAEAALLESQAELRLQNADAALDAVRRARDLFDEAKSDPAFDGARCDYFEASCLFFLARYDEAVELLEEAAEGFAEVDQDHWIGRVEMTLGMCQTQLEDHDAALEHYETAIGMLDQQMDALAWGATQVNYGILLGRLGDVAKARQAFRLALSSAIRYGIATVARGARFNLAELNLTTGEPAKALPDFQTLAELAKADNNINHLVMCQVYVAECLGMLGRDREMVDSLKGIHIARGRMAFGEPAIEELLACLDRGDLDLRVVSHVRQYLKATEAGSREEYRWVRVS